MEAKIIFEISFFFFLFINKLVFFSSVRNCFFALEALYVSSLLYILDKSLISALVRNMLSFFCFFYFCFYFRDVFSLSLQGKKCKNFSSLGSQRMFSSSFPACVHVFLEADELRNKNSRSVKERRSTKSAINSSSSNNTNSNGFALEKQKVKHGSSCCPCSASSASSSCSSCSSCSSFSSLLCARPFFLFHSLSSVRGVTPTNHDVVGAGRRKHDSKQKTSLLKIKESSFNVLDVRPHFSSLSSSSSSSSYIKTKLEKEEESIFSIARKPPQKQEVQEEEEEEIQQGLPLSSYSSSASNSLKHVFTLTNDMPLLDKITSPKDIKTFTIKEIEALAKELRADIIHKVSKTGGHLSASLGVAELTAALHYVFDTPHDKIVWDVSHQAYAHKILTGRRNYMHTLRQKDGLSGFCKRSESLYDSFGAGHSSTSISAAQGIAVGQNILKKKRSHCIAVIGDGGITGGMAFEAMNTLSYLNSRIIIILNDNGQVSLPTGMESAGGTVPAGALSYYTTGLLSSRPYQNFKDIPKGVSKLFLPHKIELKAAKIDGDGASMLSSSTISTAASSTLFEQLGLSYVGPVDGHDIENLIYILNEIKKSNDEKSVLLHIKTEKGFGYVHALRALDKMHGVVKFDVHTGVQHKSKNAFPSLTHIFADELCHLGEIDPAVVAITAAMPGGTGVGIFGKKFPSRTFDVGIAEQHAVTFAAGMACEGVKPFCAIYSTFLQRAYDQLIHDVVLQNLPVRFIIDRAGLVGADGATHHGTYDLSYLMCLPNIIVMAASNELELKNMIRTVYEVNDRPSAVRYPRGSAYGLQTLNEKFRYNLKEMPAFGEPLKIGKGRIVKQARPNAKHKVAVLSLGCRLLSVIEASELIEKQCEACSEKKEKIEQQGVVSEKEDISITIADARFLKPLDTTLIKELVEKHDYFITIEEGSVGGFSSAVLDFLMQEGLLDKTHNSQKSLYIRCMTIPDKFIEAATQDEQYEEAKLNAKHIYKTIINLVTTNIAKNNNA